MRVQLLTFAGCPNAATVREALRQAMRQLSIDASIEEVDLEAPGTTADLRGWPSPTILVDGADLEGRRQTNDGEGCRLYAGKGGAPPVEEIARRLAVRMTPQAPKAARRIAIGGAIAAAFAASACCVGPALLALVGISGVGFAAALEPYRPALLVLTGALLGGGFYLTYRWRSTIDHGDADACGCERPRVARSGRRLLWTATVLAVALAAYPFGASLLTRSVAAGSNLETSQAAVARLHVVGMTCRACSSHLTEALAALPGVVRATVSYSDGVAEVRYAPRKIKPQAFVDAITRAGYEARVDATAAVSP